MAHIFDFSSNVFEPFPCYNNAVFQFANEIIPFIKRNTNNYFC